jgi:hypothetical protein
MNLTFFCIIKSSSTSLSWGEIQDHQVNRRSVEERTKNKCFFSWQFSKHQSKGKIKARVRKKWSWPRLTFFSAKFISGSDSNSRDDSINSFECRTRATIVWKYFDEFSEGKSRTLLRMPGAMNFFVRWNFLSRKSKYFAFNICWIKKIEFEVESSGKTWKIVASKQKQTQNLLSVEMKSKSTNHHHFFSCFVFASVYDEISEHIFFYSTRSTCSQRINRAKKNRASTKFISKIYV